MQGRTETAAFGSISNSRMAFQELMQAALEICMKLLLLHPAKQAASLSQSTYGVSGAVPEGALGGQGWI